MRASTKKWMGRFLKALAETCNVRSAADAAGISRSAAYVARGRDPAFAEAWEDALDDALDVLEAEVRRRALEGTEEPVYYLGQKVGVVRKYSDNLAMFLLKAYRPERFRDVNLQQLADAILQRLAPQAEQQPDRN